MRRAPTAKPPLSRRAYNRAQLRLRFRRILLHLEAHRLEHLGRAGDAQKVLRRDEGLRHESDKLYLAQWEIS